MKRKIQLTETELIDLIGRIISLNENAVPNLPKLTADASHPNGNYRIEDFVGTLPKKISIPKNLSNLTSNYNYVKGGGDFVQLNDKNLTVDAFCDTLKTGRPSLLLPKVTGELTSKYTKYAPVKYVCANGNQILNLVSITNQDAETIKAASKGFDYRKEAPNLISGYKKPSYT